jgi:hypothetical protein
LDFQQALTLSADLQARKTAESAQTAKNVELEARVTSQAEKIIELETSYVNLKHEKESMKE